MRTRRKSLKFGGRMDPTHWDGGVADALQGRLVAPIHATLGRADGHVAPLDCAKFHLNRHRGWECGPKISKISTFW